MAFEFNDLTTFLFLVFFFIIPSTSSTNIDCNGKPYYCVNSTHFMICVDLGGKISTTIDDTVLACPPPTECRASNRYECEFPINEVSPTLQPVIDETNSNGINGSPSLNEVVTTALPIVATNSSTQTNIVVPMLEGNQLSNNTDILDNLRKEYTDGKDTLFQSVNTTPSNGKQINNTNAFSTEATTNIVKIYSTEHTKDWTALGVTTILPMEVTIINTNKIYSTESMQDVTTVLPTEVIKSPFIETNKSEILEEIRKEFTDSNDMVFNTINTTPSKDVSHNVEKSIDVPSPTTVTMSDADELFSIFSTNHTTKEVSSIYTSTLDVTMTSPIEVTTKLVPIQNGTDFTVLKENKFVNETDVLELIRKEYTDSKDMVFESINTTRPSNMSHNDKQINDTNSLPKQTTLGVTTILPFVVSAKSTVTAESIIDTDEIHITESTTDKVTILYSSTISVKTVLPIEVNTISPFAQTNKTKILEDIRKEFADSKDTVFKSINTTTSKDVTPNIENSISAKTPIKATTADPDKIYSTEYTTSPIEITTDLPLIQFGTDFPVLEKNKFVNNTELLEHIRKEFTDSKDTVFETINTMPPNNINHNVEQIIVAQSSITDKTYTTESIIGTTSIYAENMPKVLDIPTLANKFDESNYNNTEHPSKSTANQLPAINKEFIKIDMDVTASPDPFIDTEQRINLEKPPDYSTINKHPKATVLAKVETLEHTKIFNLSNISETVPKSNNSDLFNFMDSENIVNDEITKSINITISRPGVNVSHFTTQHEKMRENYTQTNNSQSIETYIATTPTYDTTSIKINKNATNVIEQNINSNLDKVNDTDKSVHDSVLSHLYIRPVTFNNGELHKKQELSTTNITMTENKKKITEIMKLEYVTRITSETNKMDEKEVTNVFITSQYPLNETVKNTTVTGSGTNEPSIDYILHNTSNFLTTEASVSKATIFTNEIYHINLTGIVESNNATTDPYDITKDMILLTSTDTTLYEIKQIKNASQNAYSVNEGTLKGTIITAINKIRADELSTSNSTILTEATVLFKSTSQETSSMKTDTDKLSLKQMSSTDVISPITESPHNNKAQVTEDTPKSKPQSDKVVYEKPLITAKNQVTNPLTIRQVKGTTSLPQADKDIETLAELEETQKQPLLHDSPISQTSNDVVSTTSLVEGVFIKPIKLDTSTESPTEVISSNVTQIIGYKLKRGPEVVEEVAAGPFVNVFSPENMTQVTTIATPSSKIITEENNITKVIPSVTLLEEISTTKQLKGTTSLPKMQHKEKSSIIVVSNTPYIRPTLPINVMDITKHTSFPITVPSPSSPTDSSRLVATDMPPIEELSTTNTIESTLFTSSTERQFPTINYTNNEKISTLSHLMASQVIKEFGSVNTPSINCSDINKENIKADSKMATDLAATPVVMITESMQPSPESTVTGNFNKIPSIIKDLNLKQNTPMPSTYGLDKLVVPTFSANNVDETNINTNSTFIIPDRTRSTIKHTAKSSILINKISSTMPITRESVDELIKHFTTESSQPSSSTATRADNTLKNVPIDIVTEPSSVVEMINIKNTKNKKEVVAPKMMNTKENVEYSNQLNKQTALNTKLQNMTVNSKEFSSKAHIKVSNDSSIAPKIKVGDQDGEIDEKDQQTTKNYETTTTHRTITSSIDNLTKNYKKRDIATIEHVFNLKTGPNTNVVQVEVPELRKTYIKEETSTPIYKTAIHTVENNTPTIIMPEKVTKASNNIKADNSIQNQAHTTTHPTYHSISYTQTQQTTNKLISPIPSTTDHTNTNEKLNKIAFKCLNHSLGKYGDNTDCRKFYICVGTLQPIVGICPNNTVFSEINRHCTKNLSHCVRKNQFHCLYEGRFVDYTKDNIYFICVKNNLHGFIRYKLQCLKGYHVNKVSVKCEKDIDLSESASEVSEPEANSDQNGSGKREESEISENEKYLECKKEGNFPYPKDCRKYYVCSKNKNGDYRRKIKSCSTEKRYDKGKNKCVVADSSDEC